MLCCFSPSAVISVGMALYNIYLYVCNRVSVKPIWMNWNHYKFIKSQALFKTWTLHNNTTIRFTVDRVYPGAIFINITMSLCQVLTNPLLSNALEQGILINLPKRHCQRRKLYLIQLIISVADCLLLLPFRYWTTKKAPTFWRIFWTVYITFIRKLVSTSYVLI